MLEFPDTDDDLDRALEAWRNTGDSHGSWRKRIKLARTWEQPERVEMLEVGYEFERSGRNESLHATLNGCRIPLDQPVQLIPVTVSKPWGQELWFTGIERRGESRVSATGGELGIASYLAMAPHRLCQNHSLVLAKVLNPFHESERGDLYMEMHETKEEVYVVTHIDEASWPSGRGAIRLGISQARRAEFETDGDFRSAYLSAVLDYERLRRAQEGGKAVDPGAETAARRAMEAFTDLRPLSVGDVVQVPRLLPHSLQHGVRVVELQTPVFERKIISFGQRVATQDHWDSEAAIASLSLEVPPQSEPEVMSPDTHRIASIDEFGIWRTRVEPGKSLTLPARLPYAVCITLTGTLAVGSLEITREAAAFIPGSAAAEISNHTDETAICLTVGPGL